MLPIKKEGILKRLKNIEDQSKINEENENNQLSVKSIGYTVKEVLSQEAKNMLKKLNNQEKLINYRKLNIRGGNNMGYDFNDYRSLKEFFKAIYFRKLSIEEVERIQDKLNTVLGVLEMYNLKIPKYKKGRIDLLISAKNFYEGREIIINAFKNKIFPVVPSDYPSEDEDMTPRSLSPDISSKSGTSDSEEDVSKR